MSECVDVESGSIELVITARPRDLGGFSVRRLLPYGARRMVGPFIFFDHMGPAELELGAGLDVRPHPHIALATLTYLFEGEIIHRDSLGNTQAIHPGDVNWMLAGSGIAHSERSSPEERERGVRLHGIQCWVALPLEHEEHEPLFDHYPESSIPSLELDGAWLDVVAGSAFGRESPVRVLSPTLYVHARLDAGARLAVDTEHEARGVYVVSGAIRSEGQRFDAGSLVVLRPGRDATLAATENTRLMLLGGAELEGERHVWWNFVSSSEERIEHAKEDWKSGRFAKVVGDETDFIPLPDH